MLLLGPNFLLHAPSSLVAEIRVFLEPKTIWTCSPKGGATAGWGLRVLSMLGAVGRPRGRVGRMA